MKWFRTKWKVVLFVIAVIVVGAAGVYIWKIHPVKVEAVWLDDNWKYRNAVPVTKTTADQTNVYISVTIDTSASGQFQADCGDLRWTDQNGKVLPYYIVSGCTSASTVIHVYFSSLPQGTQTIYYYYGNSSASNGFNSMDFPTVATNYSVGSIASQETTPGPLAYWKFDEGYGTTTADTTASSNTATFAGSTTPSWATEDMCVSGKCLSFPGNTADLTVANTVSGVETVSFWARSASSSAALIALNSNARIWAKSGVISAEGFTGATVYVNGVATTTFTANKWQFIEVTSTAAISASAITIGRVFSVYHSGFMDEVKLYAATRTAAQVQADYIARGTIEGAGASLGLNKWNETSALSSDLVGYWELDESSGNPVDSSGNGTTLTNVATTTFTTGKFNRAASLNGTSQYLYAADNATLSLTGSLTMAAWIYPTSVSGTRDIIGKWDGTHQSYLLQQSATSLVCYIDSSSNYVTTTGLTLAINTWYHVACVYDANAQTATIYVNGVAQATTTTGTIPSSIGDDTDAFQIGAQDRNNTPKDFFSGYIDEARVYNRALSSSDMTQLYEWAPGPVAWWKFDEHTGTSAYDSSGNGNVGTLGNGTAAYQPTWAAGKYGSALSFDGTNDYVSVADNTTLKPPDITIELWFKSSASPGSNQQFITKNYTGVSGAASYTLALEQSSSWKVNFSTYDSTWRTITSDASGYNDGNWHHVAGVNLGTTNYLYVDGKLQSGTATSATMTYDTGTLEFGRWYSGSNYTNGSLDDIRIYSYARTSRQITEDMNAGHPAPGSPVGSSQGWWKFDEGYGTTLHNAGSFGTSANATASGTMWNPNGMFNYALQYNGTTSYAATPNLAFMAANSATYNTLSWGAWVYPAGAVASKNIIVKNNEFRLTTDSNSKANCAIYSGGWQTAAVSSPALSLNTWAHVMCTYDGTTITVYVNGVSAGTAAQTGSLTSSNTTGINFGWSAQGSQYFTGLIDEAKVYNIALTATEMKLEYNRASAVKLGSLSDTSGLTGGSSASSSAAGAWCVPGDTTSCAMPIGIWPFDEGTGTSAYDISGNGKTGTLTSSSMWAGGKWGKGVQFNGSSQAVTATIASAGNTNTIELWVYPTTSAASKNIINTGSNVLTTDSSSRPVYGGCTGQPLSLNTWTHITAVSNGASVCQIYQNGFLVSSGTTGVTLSTALNIGVSSFSGTIDNVVIFNYARTDAQVAWDYHRGKPDEWWKFDECYGSTVYNSADPPGSTQSATLTIGGSGSQTSVGNCVTVLTSAARYNGRSGKINSAINFDGNDDYIQTPSNFMMTANNFSIALWFKAAATDCGHHLVFAGQWAGDGWGNGASCGSGSDWSMHVSLGQIEDTGSSTCIDNRLSFFLGRKDNCTSNLNLGIDFSDTTNWHHVVVVVSNMSSSPAASMYVDGVLRATDTGNTTETARTWQTPILIARPGVTGSRFYNGLLDDVRFYNYALTAAQVKMVYNGDATFNIAPSTGQP